MEEKVSHARKVAIRIANAICYGEFDEYFKESGITYGITEKDIWTYIDSAYDVFPRGSADQLAPIVIEILEKRKWPGLLKK